MKASVLFHSLKLREEKSHFIMRKTADGVRVKATEYVSCLEKSATDRKEKVPFLKLGRLVHIFGRGERARYGACKRRE